MTRLKGAAERHAKHVADTTADEPTTTMITNLDGWTSDQLFAETLKRRAGDPPALRVMQELTLQAQLTAHDGA
ncbi:MAG: hypothetical protein WBD55_11070 [Dehalococcoidia bacterium]